MYKWCYWSNTNPITDAVLGTFLLMALVAIGLFALGWALGDEEGKKKGKTEGHNEGHGIGYNAGYTAAYTAFTTQIDEIRQVAAWLHAHNTLTLERTHYQMLQDFRNLQ